MLLPMLLFDVLLRLELLLLFMFKRALLPAVVLAKLGR